METKQKIVLTGGGSAGHVTPNLALVDDLQKSGLEVHYIGTHEGIERSIVKDLPYHAITAGKLRRYFSMKNLTDMFRIFKGYFQAKKILKKLRPALVFAKGGFVSVPVVWAAAKLGIPSVLHESDFTPGLANRLCSKKATKICLSFDNMDGGGGKYIVTGSPIRKEVLEGNYERGCEFLGFKKMQTVLLIMGGSLGAKAVNDVVDQAIDALTDEFFVVHLRGKDNLNPALEGRESYRQFEYLYDELKDIYAVADLALSRSGANAIFEFLALKLPALLIPLPLSASRGDQILNADYFEERGYAKVLSQDALTPESLLAKLTDLREQKDTMTSSMESAPQSSGTQNVLDVIYSLIKSG